MTEKPLFVNFLFSVGLVVLGWIAVTTNNNQITLSDIKGELKWMNVQATSIKEQLSDHENRLNALEKMK